MESNRREKKQLGSRPQAQFEDVIVLMTRETGVNISNVSGLPPPCLAVYEQDFSNSSSPKECSAFCASVLGPGTRAPISPGCAYAAEGAGALHVACGASELLIFTAAWPSWSPIGAAAASLLLGSAIAFAVRKGSRAVAVMRGYDRLEVVDRAVKPRPDRCVIGGPFTQGRHQFPFKSLPCASDAEGALLQARVSLVAGALDQALHVALVLAFIMDACPGYAAITALGIAWSLDPLQVRGLLALQSAMDEGYAVPASLRHQWASGTSEARITAAVSFVALMSTEPSALSWGIVLLQLTVILSSFMVAMPAATEAEALLRIPGLIVADFYMFENSRACLASGRFADASATVTALTATVFAHRSFQNGDDGAQRLIKGLVVIWVALAPSVSFYNCGWWCEWRKCATYILFFTWAVCVLSILDLESTEGGSCQAPEAPAVRLQSVHCLAAAASAGCPGSLLQVALLALGSLSFAPTLFLDERLHARTVELRAAMLLRDPQARLEEVAQVEEGRRLNVDREVTAGD